MAAGGTPRSSSVASRRPVDPKLQKIIDKANKKYGDDTIVVGSQIKNRRLPRITSGSLALDVALGGGWAVNKWNEIVGDESAGKTALVLLTIAANQKLDPEWTTLWFAAEDFNVDYAEMLDVDLDRLVVVDSNSMEFVFQTSMDALGDRATDSIVIDSLPALVSDREDEGTMEDLQPGQAAFLTGKFFRKSQPKIKRSLLHEERPCTGLIINQWREKIGVMHGDPRTTPGGKGKNFYFYIRVETRRKEWITNTKSERTGQVIAVRNIKNKTAPPGITAEFDYYFKRANGIEAGRIDTLKDIITVGIEYEVIARRGAWYDFGGQSWQGREALVDALREDEGLQELVRKEVMEIIAKGAPAEDDDEEPEEEPAPKPKVTRTRAKK